MGKDGHSRLEIRRPTGDFSSASPEKFAREISGLWELLKFRDEALDT